MAQKRTSRYQKSENPAQIDLQRGKYYYPILELVYQYRYLTHNHILALLNGLGYGISDSYLRDLLRQLFHNSYLHRRHRPKAVGSLPDIYTLDEAGAAALALHKGLFIDDLSYPKPPSKHKPHKGSPATAIEYLDHSLLITDVLTSFTLACLKHPEWKLSGFSHDLEKLTHLHIHVRAPGFSSVPIPVCPDGFIIIQRRSGPHQGKWALFLLECDRMTQQRSIIKRKMVGYLELHRQQKHFDFLRRICIDQLNIPEEELTDAKLNTFRVLFITLSQQRNLNLVKTAYSIAHKETEMFWFAAQDILSLEPSRNILTEPAWQVGVKSIKGNQSLI